MTLSDVSVAVAPSNIDAVPNLLEAVASAAGVFTKQGGNTVIARRQFLTKLRDLTHALETPREMMVQHCWAQPSNAMAIAFGAQSGLWNAMANNGDGPQKVADLAKQLGLQEELLQRMMRHIAASGYINMTALDVYTPNNFSKSLALKEVNSGYCVDPPILNPSFFTTPKWLKKKGYECATSNQDSPFQAGHKRIIDGCDTAGKDAVLLVDVAGDLPSVLDQAKEPNPQIEKMPYDFFTAQPVKGARIYYTHFILHDWPDHDAVKIARGGRDAMKPGYSRFLVHDHVVPPMGQDYEQTALDLIMMTNFGSKERSAAQWSELLGKQCGLKIVKI
ncbi:S-adenosyl-L-methionine-dependent methyltransferase [Xylariaceae sp. FL1272]|nr:S-adenosyl-L-methionine-dependent methyltransferase [Xylariaceae sp. FL1272]